MIIDATYFGYGAGLVMVGWVCGLVVSLSFSTMGKMR